MEYTDGPLQSTFCELDTYGNQELASLTLDELKKVACNCAYMRIYSLFKTKKATFYHLPAVLRYQLEAKYIEKNHPELTKQEENLDAEYKEKEAMLPVIRKKIKEAEELVSNLKLELDEAENSCFESFEMRNTVRQRRLIYGKRVAQGLFTGLEEDRKKRLKKDK